jgi:glycine/serine hydroxymethyltransferase
MSIEQEPQMKTYFLQKEKSGRLFIDNRLHEGCEKIDTVEAECWKEAKAKLTLPT